MLPTNLVSPFCHIFVVDSSFVVDLGSYVNMPD